MLRTSFERVGGNLLRWPKLSRGPKIRNLYGGGKWPGLGNLLSEMFTSGNVAS